MDTLFLPLNSNQKKTSAYFTWLFLLLLKAFKDFKGVLSTKQGC